MAKKVTKKKLIFDTTIEIDALQVAALIRGERLVIDQTEIVLSEGDELDPSDILQMITEDVESARTEKTDEESEEESYDESEEIDEDED
jgi:hypothetical protein